MHRLRVLEARKSKIKVSAGPGSLWRPREGPVQNSLLASRQFLVLWQHNTNLHMVFSLVCVQTSPSCKDTSHIGLGAQHDPVSTSFPVQQPHFPKQGHIPRGQGLELQCVCSIVWHNSIHKWYLSESYLEGEKGTTRPRPYLVKKEQSLYRSGWGDVWSFL